ncbi:hypothetical protein [Nitrosomonas oligotropha]|uniref:Uncharacterized protein n=1 Tax=Nitrosomonas oligotropha TaxID=42354 RepID=A0A1H8RPG9_9PROT|nr:hypothetical protein [Nitrosomonas oligotropha]SDX03982.1 hypothetical protein SAMN05216300_11636 [Nitrosomonas oligotropha]SEO68459.1 hypothetical protein SAMN05216333_11536 [Nitrosomonas oligotropha]
MEAAEIIEYLRDRDLTITLTDGDSLELSPAEKITHELIERLRKHKPAIIQELKREQNQKIEIIRAWLHIIGEPEEDHFLVLDKCLNNPEALEYFLEQAKEVN